MRSRTRLVLCGRGKDTMVEAVVQLGDDQDDDTQPNVVPPHHVLPTMSNPVSYPCGPRVKVDGPIKEDAIITIYYPHEGVRHHPVLYCVLSVHLFSLTVNVFVLLISVDGPWTGSTSWPGSLVEPVKRPSTLYPRSSICIPPIVVCYYPPFLTHPLLLSSSSTPDTCVSTFYISFFQHA